MREYIVTIGDEEFHVSAVEYGFNRARYLGYKEYLNRHPEITRTLSSLLNSGLAKVRVANDRRIKY